MGAVWEAENLLTERLFAVKVVSTAALAPVAASTRSRVSCQSHGAEVPWSSMRETSTALASVTKRTCTPRPRRLAPLVTRRQRCEAARQQADAAQIRAWEGEGGALRPGAPDAH